jgi:hypothetical protein
VSVASLIIAIATIITALAVYYGSEPEGADFTVWPAVVAGGWVVFSLLFTAGVWIYRDRKLTIVPAAATIIALVVLFVSFLVVAVYVTPWTIGMMLVLGLSVLVAVPAFIFGLGPIVQKKWPKVPVIAFFAPFLVAMLLFAIFLSIGLKEGFLGFSLAWCLLFISVLVVIVVQNTTDLSYLFRANRTIAISGILSSPGVFPIVQVQQLYENISSKGTADISQQNSRLMYPMVLLAMLFTWGVVANFFLDHPSISLSICCLVRSFTTS